MLVDPLPKGGGAFVSAYEVGSGDFIGLGRPTSNDFCRSVLALGFGFGRVVP
jgi:hypothetical protein